MNASTSTTPGTAEAEQLDHLVVAEHESCVALLDRSTARGAREPAHQPRRRGEVPAATHPHACLTASMSAVLVSGAEAGSFTVELRPQPTKIVAYQNGAMHGEPSTKCPSLSRPVEAQAACASR